MFVNLVHANTDLAPSFERGFFVNTPLKTLEIVVLLANEGREHQFQLDPSSKTCEGG